MSRVKGPGAEGLPADLHRLYQRFTQSDRDFTNQADILALSPPAFTHLYGLVEALREEGTLPQRIVEIAVVTTSHVNECPYCIAHHGTALIKHGLPVETVDGILDDEPPGLNEKERIARDYARLVTERAWGIGESFFERLRAHFSDRDIVELTVRIGLCALFNKLNQALEIGIEAGVADDSNKSGLALYDTQLNRDRPQ